MDLNTGYDSTWEDDDGGEEEDRRNTQAQEAATKPPNGKPKRLKYTAQVTATMPQNGKPQKFKYEYMYTSAARDMQKYRYGNQCRSPSYQSRPEEMTNLRFYRNEIEFKPNGLYIDDLLEAWKEDYKTLEYNHSYIQWLFPIRERGLNPHANPLHEEEIQIMKKAGDIRMRLLKAYKLMLGFYGLYLKSEETGEVDRAQNWEERFQNLNNKTHNNLRITRILKCLGILGFEHFQAPLVQFFLKETLCEGQLKNVKRSVLDYFMFSVKNKKERQDLVYFAWKHYKAESKFFWGPVDLLKKCTRQDCDTIKKLGEEDNKDNKIKPQSENKDRENEVKNDQNGINWERQKPQHTYETYTRNTAKKDVPSSCGCFPFKNAFAHSRVSVPFGKRKNKTL